MAEKKVGKRAKEKNEDIENAKLEENVDVIKSRNREFFWIVVVMVVLIGSILLTYYLIDNSKNFVYEGLKFREEKYGKLNVFRHTYNFNDNGQTYIYNLYLRNDPRKNNVSYSGEISFRKDEPIYVSVDGNELAKCEDSQMAIGALATFLTNNLLNIKGAVTDKNESISLKVPYATCENNPKDTVVLIKSGSETKISASGGDCYVIEVANCDILNAIEKFQVRSIIDARNLRKRTLMPV